MALTLTDGDSFVSYFLLLIVVMLHVCCLLLAGKIFILLHKWICVTYDFWS